MEDWACWVDECFDLMDGKCTQRHWKYPGSYEEQPAFDLDVYRVIRNKNVELINAKVEPGVGT